MWAHKFWPFLSFCFGYMYSSINNKPAELITRFCSKKKGDIGGRVFRTRPATSLRSRNGLDVLPVRATAVRPLRSAK